MAHNFIFGTGVSSAKRYEELRDLIECNIEHGIVKFDTAPSYKTENVLGSILSEIRKKRQIARDNIYIQTKIDAWQMQNGNIRKFVCEALKNLDTDYIDALLIHWPVPDYLKKTWDDFINLKKEGYIKSIGICNARERQLKEWVLWENKPEIIHIERNPLRVCEREIKICRDNGIEIQAYSPLCKMNKKIKDSTVLSQIAHKYNKNIGQIVMRWHIDTGVIPIYTTTRENRVREYTDIYDFELSENEVKSINELNENYKMYLEAWACPGF